LSSFSVLYDAIKIKKLSSLAAPGRINLLTNRNRFPRRAAKNAGSPRLTGSPEEKEKGGPALFGPFFQQWESCLFIWQTDPKPAICAFLFGLKCLILRRQTALSLRHSRGGKSGQHRAPCFLTGSRVKVRISVTENNRPFRRVRVKRCGKSAPAGVATSPAVRIMGCKTKYIPVARQGGPLCFHRKTVTGRGRLHDRTSDGAAR